MTITATDKIPESVFNVLNDIGIPQHIKGYNYMASAIYFVAQNPDAINQVTKVIYPEVAKLHGTTPSRVERAMRHAIEVVFQHTDWKVTQSYFGNSISVMSGKVTNSQFVATIASLIRRKLIAEESLV